MNPEPQQHHQQQVEQKRPTQGAISFKGGKMTVGGKDITRDKTTGDVYTDGVKVEGVKYFTKSGAELNEATSENAKQDSVEPVESFAVPSFVSKAHRRSQQVTKVDVTVSVH